MPHNGERTATLTTSPEINKSSETETYRILYNSRHMEDNRFDVVLNKKRNCPDFQLWEERARFQLFIYKKPFNEKTESLFLQELTL